jgi:hypothetical protein
MTPEAEIEKFNIRSGSVFTLTTSNGNENGNTDEPVGDDF